MNLSGRGAIGCFTVTIGVALLGAAGCSDPESVDGVATYQDFGSGSDGALLEGRLRLDPECVYIIASGKTFLPVFPSDEVERSDSELTYGGETFRDGDPIALGGGTGSLGSWATVPEGCDEPNPEGWVVGQAD